MENGEIMAERILCVLGKLRAGGVESMMYSYYRFLDKDKWQYDFIYEEDSDFGIPDDILHMGAGAFVVPNISNPIKYVKAVKEIIKKGSYRIVHSNLNTLSLFSLWAAKCCKVKIRILHNHSTSSTVEKKRDLLKKLLRPLNRFVTTNCCACSEYAGRWMYGDRAFDAGKVTVFRNGVDTDKFRFNEDNRKEIRRELNIENKTVIGHVGRFCTVKNHPFLIDLFREYYKFNADSVLLCVGGGELADEIKKYAEKSGVGDSVIFVGYRNADVFKFYSAFDIFALPSLYEGLPVAAVEACAAGLPVLMSEFVTKEALITDKCFQLPINDPTDWANKISTLIGCDREAIASQMSDGDFNIKNCIKELEDYYSMCLSRI